MNKRYDIIGFGEILLGLNLSKNVNNVSNAAVIKNQVLGLELDVVAGVSALGLKSGFISCLPRHNIRGQVLDYLRASSIATDFVVLNKYEDAKLGLYFSKEKPFPGKNDIVYNRKEAALNQLDLNELPSTIYNNCKLFHTSGVTLSLSENIYNIGLELMRRFKQEGALVSFDVNFETNLWSEAEQKSALIKILPYVDILFISERILRRTTLPQTAALKELIRDYSLSFEITTVVVVEQPRTKLKRSRLKQDPGFLIYQAQTDTFQPEPPNEGVQLSAEMNSREAYISGTLYNLLK